MHFKGAMSWYFCFLPCQNFTNFLLPLLVGNIAYYFEHKKKICDKFFRKELTKIDSVPKTWSGQSENLKELANIFKL